jgi:hypothetical protein
MKANILAQFSLAMKCLEWFRSVRWIKRMHIKSSSRSQYFAFKTITRRLNDQRAERDFYFSEDFSFIHIAYSNSRMNRLKSMTQRVWNIIIIINNCESIKILFRKEFYEISNSLRFEFKISNSKKILSTRIKDLTSIEIF